MADRQAELQDVLAAHAAMHQTQELAKAELATVEQQLLVQRAARTAQLEQHASQVGPQYQIGLQWTCTRHSCLAGWSWSLFDCKHFLITHGASCNCTTSNWPGSGSALEYILHLVCTTSSTCDDSCHAKKAKHSVSLLCISARLCSGTVHS